MPVDVEPLWDEIQRIMRLYGIEHPNKAVENGMHLEMLVAEFLAGSRVPGFDPNST